MVEAKSMQDHMLQMEALDSKELEQKIIELRRGFRYKQLKIKTGSDAEKLKKTLLDKKSQVGYFNFTEECLVYRAKLNDQSNKGRIFLIRIRDIGFGTNN